MQRFIGTIPWDIPEGLSPEGVFSGDEDRVLMTVSYYRDDAADWTVYEDNVHLVEIDPTTDRIVRETEESRCTNLSALSLTPGGTAAELVPGQEPTTGQCDPIDVDGRKLLPKVAADYASTELVELLPEGGMEPLISGPGTLLGVVRVRVR